MAPVGTPLDFSHADERAAWDALFFSGELAHPMVSQGECGPKLASALACVRLAPSAKNLQPWRLVCSGSAIDLFEYRTLPLRPIGDVQLVDMGIAMLHLEVGLANQGLCGAWSFDDPHADCSDVTPAASEGCVSYVSIISF